MNTCDGFLLRGGKKDIKWPLYINLFIYFLSPVSVWRLSAGLPSRPRLLSSGGLLHVHPLRAPRHPRSMRVCRWAGRLRRIRYDPLLPSLWLSEERLISVQPEGLPRQTPLRAPEIRWGLHLLTALEEIWFCFFFLFLMGIFIFLTRFRDHHHILGPPLQHNHPWWKILTWKRLPRRATGLVNHPLLAPSLPSPTIPTPYLHLCSHITSTD